MKGLPYLVKGRIHGETASNIVFVTEEFLANVSDEQFRQVMRSTVSDIIEEKYGPGVEFELTWERGNFAEIPVSS